MDVFDDGTDVMTFSEDARCTINGRCVWCAPACSLCASMRAFWRPPHNNRFGTGTDKGNPTVYLKQSIVMAGER